MAVLKPCPFCGGEVDFIGETQTIKCKNCGGAFIVENPLISRLKDKNPLISRLEVAVAWNTRASKERGGEK